MICLPMKPEDAAAALHVLSLPAGTRQRVLDNLRRFMITPWHYHSRHSVRNKCGSWSLWKAATFRDTECKIFSLAASTVNVQQYIDEENLSPGFVRGAFDNSIPSWVCTLVRQQRDATRSATTSSRATASHPPTSTVPLPRSTSTVPLRQRPRK